MWDVLSGVAEMARDVLSGAAKMARDVLSGVTKTTWDVLSRDVLSYIRVGMSARTGDPRKTLVPKQTWQNQQM